ncbi:MAG: SCP2 sterol-binding domain-containing protein [Anaerolineaceae bacterium]|nr:SCP2 sterol-binding domain-containing protein [Anaerolineaceae bacterium]
METIEDFIKAVPTLIDESKTVGVQARIQLNLSGEGGGNYYVVVNDGSVKVEKGKLENPQMTLSASTETALELLKGKVNPMNAVMTGKVKIAGDMSVGMKLFKLFS